MWRCYKRCSILPGFFTKTRNVIFKNSNKLQTTPYVSWPLAKSCAKGRAAIAMSQLWINWEQPQRLVRQVCSMSIPFLRTILLHHFQALYAQIKQCATVNRLVAQANVEVRQCRRKSTEVENVIVKGVARKSVKIFWIKNNWQKHVGWCLLQEGNKCTSDTDCGGYAHSCHTWTGRCDCARMGGKFKIRALDFEKKNYSMYYTLPVYKRQAVRIHSGRMRIFGPNDKSTI